MNHARRSFFFRAFAAGAGLYGLSSGAVGAAKEASSQPLRKLTARQAATLAAIGEALVPGSRAAGLAHYVDHQLCVPAAESMLMGKYVGLVPPFVDFYRRALDALVAVAHARYGKEIAALDAADMASITSDFAVGKLAHWKAPPQGLAYFVLRSDAVDVVYGTPEGFARLNVPYMAHIAPPTRWGE